MGGSSAGWKKWDNKEERIFTHSLQHHKLVLKTKDFKYKMRSLAMPSDKKDLIICTTKVQKIVLD